MLAVVTRDDLRDIDPYYSVACRDQAILAVDGARFARDAVAAVVAEDERTAVETLGVHASRCRIARGWAVWRRSEGGRMLRPFEIHQPESVQAASGLVARHGEEAVFYAGGTEVLLVMKEGLVRYRHLVDVKTIPGLSGIAYDAATQTLQIGCTATHCALEEHPAVCGHFPLVAQVETQVANTRVRNVGTIGGNLCFAEPHADPGTLFLAYDAEIELASVTETRTIAAEQFFTGAFETARRYDEVLTQIRLKRWGPHTRGAYMKFGFHERPTLGVAVALTLDAAHQSVQESRIAVGCVGPKPFRARAAETALRGVSLTDAERKIDEAAGLASADAEAISDLHGSAEYKQEMVKVFVRRALRAAVARFQ